MKIKILSSCIFSGKSAGKGDVITVSPELISDARFLIGVGFAVEIAESGKSKKAKGKA